MISTCIYHYIISYLYLRGIVYLTLPVKSILLQDLPKFALPASARGYVSGYRGGLGGFKRTPIEPKLFHFHGEFQKKLVKLHKSNPSANLNPRSKNRGSAPVCKSPPFCSCILHCQFYRSRSCTPVLKECF